MEMHDPYRSLAHRPYDSLYLYVDTVIHHPVEKVWAQALRIGDWMSAHRLETIDGEPGQVGHFERVHPRNIASEVPQPHYHLYGITHIEPLKVIVLDVFPENGGSYGKTRPKMSFDSILFADLGMKTQVAFQMIDVHLGKGGEQFIAHRQREMEGVREMFNEYFENLRQLVSKER